MKSKSIESIKPWILNNLRLKEGRNIDESSIKFGKTVVMFVIYCAFSALFITIFDYRPITDYLIILALIGVMLIFYYIYLTPKTRIYKDALVIKRKFSSHDKIIHWKDVKQVKIKDKIHRSGGINNYTKTDYIELHLKNQEYPIKISMGFDELELVEIYKDFIEYMR